MRTSPGMENVDTNPTASAHAMQDGGTRSSMDQASSSLRNSQQTEKDSLQRIVLASNHAVSEREAISSEDQTQSFLRTSPQKVKDSL